MRTFVIEIEIAAEDMLVSEIREYVEDAVNCWGGQFHPDNPMFGDNKTVRIKKCGLKRKDK